MYVCVVCYMHALVCMCVCTYVCVYVCMNVACLCPCVFTHTHYKDMFLCIYVCLYACMPVCLSVCMYVGRCHMYMCMCIGLYTRMYVLVFFICPSCLAYLENFFKPSIRSCCEPEALRSFPRSPLACSLWDSFRDLPETNPSMPKLQT